MVDIDPLGINSELGNLWNNSYFSLVPLFDLFGDQKIREATLRLVPLSGLHASCMVSQEMRRWVQPYHRLLN